MNNLHNKSLRLRELLDVPGNREAFNDEVAERAAIMEFDGRLSRHEAEARARQEVAERWLERR